MTRITWGASLLGFASMLACGGDSSRPTVPQTGQPTIQITSPANGEIFANGSRSVTLAGGGSDFTSVEVKLNGLAIAATDVVVQGNGFTATVTLENNTNMIEAIASGAGGSASSGVIAVSFPFVALSRFQPASVVIGQETFTSNEAAAAAANTMQLPPRGAPWQARGISTFRTPATTECWCTNRCRAQTAPAR